MTETYLEPWYTYKMELPVKLANGFQPLPISTKISILDIWHGSGYVSVLWAGLIDVQLLKKKKKIKSIWYFLKLSHSRILRRKKFFDVNSAKKGISLSVKPSATYISSNKDTAYPISSVIFFHHQRPFHVKWGQKT